MNGITAMASPIPFFDSQPEVAATEAAAVATDLDNIFTNDGVLGVVVAFVRDIVRVPFCLVKSENMFE